MSRGSNDDDQIRQMLYDKSNQRYDKMNEKPEPKKPKKKKRTKKLHQEVEGQKEDGTKQSQGGIMVEKKKLKPLEQECQYILSKLEERFPQTKMNGKKNI